ncbi:MAG: site-specific integrase, partial [Planctomycetales bacterium]|nr:site-specific integrase [Planctomycetales bacterium]
DQAILAVAPQTHKTEHLGKSRAIAVGPKAQAVLNPYLMRPDVAYCFSPRESEKQRRQTRSEARKTPASYGNCPGSNRKASPKKQPGLKYDVASYRKAVQRACKIAKVEQWTPNQLRHTRGTEVRKTHGLEGAQAVLGHSTADTTQIYAKLELERAVDIARQSG